MDYHYHPEWFGIKAAIIAENLIEVSIGFDHVFYYSNERILGYIGVFGDCRTKADTDVETNHIACAKLTGKPIVPIEDILALITRVISTTGGTILQQQIQVGPKAMDLLNCAEDEYIPMVHHNHITEESYNKLEHFFGTFDNYYVHSVARGVNEVYIYVPNEMEITTNKSIPDDLRALLLWASKSGHRRIQVSRIIYARKISTLQTYNWESDP